jgi:hypothetical protein
VRRTGGNFIFRENTAISCQSGFRGLAGYRRVPSANESNSPAVVAEALPHGLVEQPLREFRVWDLGFSADRARGQPLVQALHDERAAPADEPPAFPLKGSRPFQHPRPDFCRRFLPAGPGFQFVSDGQIEFAAFVQFR